MGGWSERVMGQKGFFDVERRLEAISAKGDPLETIKKMVRWEDFRADIEAVTETRPEERQSNAGRKPYDTILKFKIVVLQSLHNLSDAQTARGMGEAARQECPEGQGRALDEEERRKLLRLQEPSRRGQGAQADPQMGCDGRGRARQSEAGRCARSLQHRQGGLGGQRLPLGADLGGRRIIKKKEPNPPARRTQSSAVRAPEVGEHDALEGARPCRARIRPPAELDGRHDRAYHRHRAGEVQDRDDEPRLQHPPVGSARAGGGCARLSALTGGVRVASCKRTARSPAGLKTVPDRGLPWARALQPLAQPRQKSRKGGIVRGAP